MGERKGLTKYYPPDFDPSKLSRIKRPKDGQISSHFMLPMSVRCLTCGEFMGAGLKFNAKKSTAAETYLGAKIFRFSMKCKACPAAFIVKTDPERGDYVCEAGAKRNFQPWRADKDKDEEAAAVREDQDRDAMQELENKTLDARQEMEELDALDELRASRARSARVSADVLLNRHRETHDAEAQLEEETRSAFRARQAVVRRLDDVGSHPPAGDAGETLAPRPAAAATGKRKVGAAAGAASSGLVVVPKKKARLPPPGLVAYGGGSSSSSSAES
jgi:hypothetical protein